MILTHGYKLNMIVRVAVAVAMLSVAISLQSCFTGIEGTRKISDKDVDKSLSTWIVDKPVGVLDSLSLPQVSDWLPGKRFVVTDNNFKHIVLSSSALNPDTLKLAGQSIFFRGTDYQNWQGIENTLVLLFDTASGMELRCNTGKSERDMAAMTSPYRVPFTIDCDVVEAADKLLSGREFYINTPLWYNASGQHIGGIRYERVRIEGVLPGNKVYTYNIKFSSADAPEAYVYVASKEDVVDSRRFGNIFSEYDPHRLYPDISDEVWQLIKVGRIRRGMSKGECRLSVGAPSRINKRPTYNGLEEYWVYDNGIYLVFVDGILDKFRR